MAFDNSLAAFPDIKQQWNGILVGNGASRAVADSFAYSSLYDTASGTGIAHPLQAHEQSIFAALKTKNFEQVLSALGISTMVGHAFGIDVAEIETSYDRIRAALVEAVHAVHVPHASVPIETLTAVRVALLTYDFVYSTNYDLLIYWSIMENPAEFRDYFFSGMHFDIGNTEVWSKATKVLYLHGGLHLYRTYNGATVKRQAGAWGNLLDDFGSPIPDVPEAVPLFISEGASADKLRSIFTSDYLAFAYNQFSRQSGPLVIFGQSLEEQYDQHLISAIQGGSNRILGVGIHPASLGAKSVAEIKAHWFTKFPNFELHFFDSTTHPLGNAALQTVP